MDSSLMLHKVQLKYRIFLSAAGAGMLNSVSLDGIQWLEISVLSPTFLPADIGRNLGRALEIPTQG